MRRRILLLGLTLTAATLAAPAAMAGDNVRADGRFTIWTPDPWVVETGKPNFIAHNPQNTIQVVAARLPGAAGAVAARAKAFVEAELDEVDYEGDTLAGSAEDEGDEVAFIVRTVVDGPDVLIVLTYGDEQLLGQPGPKQALERIRASLKAQ
ncbi:MAG: hypothetical protein HY059_13925 [Proteobacteria bacterium]|nr:hypothetical protein [Pseudomonadota bacterium]